MIVSVVTKSDVSCDIFSLVHLPVPSISIDFVANLTRSVVFSRSSVHLRTNVSWTSVNSAKVSGQIQVSYDREEVFLNNGVNMTLERVPLAVYSYLPLIVGRTGQRWWGWGRVALFAIQTERLNGCVLSNFSYGFSEKLLQNVCEVSARFLGFL